MKRFYNSVAVAERDDGFVIELDGREVKTPEKRKNLSPTRALAEAICQEWQAQKDNVKPDSMPISKLQHSAIDRVATRRGDMIDALITYAGTDLLCYRADFPHDLARRQADSWQPLLDWLHHHHDVALKVTTGIIHIKQDQAALAKIENLLQGYDNFRLTAFYTIATLCGSVTVAFNVAAGNITTAQAWQAAQLDENYQSDHWGRDDEARIRQDNIKADLNAAVRFLELLVL